MATEIADFGVAPVIVVKICRGLKDGKSVYDAARAAWKLNLSRARNADYVVAACRGEILGVFEPEFWASAGHPQIRHLAAAGEAQERIGFVGRPAPRALASRWVGRHLPPELMKRGDASPARYVNC